MTIVTVVTMFYIGIQKTVTIDTTVTDVFGKADEGENVQISKELFIKPTKYHHFEVSETKKPPYGE